jgi:hypothetical protein
MPTSGCRQEASGVIADLFAEQVGFYASWGFSRSIAGIGRKMLTPSGNIAWKEADAEVQAALVDVVAAPSAGAGAYPDGVLGFGPDLFADVAVGQHFSGWASVPGKKAQRLVLLRCHMGKRRAGGRLENQALLQYRAWVKNPGGKPKQVLEAAGAWSLFKDVHAEIELRLKR